MKTVYQFPNGFRDSAECIYGWLRHYGLTPQWTGDLAIGLPDNEVECLHLMARADPARFGNESSLLA